MLTLIRKNQLTLRFCCQECNIEYLSNEYILTFNKDSSYKIKINGLRAVWISMIFERKCPECGCTNTYYDLYSPDLKSMDFAAWLLHG